MNILWWMGSNFRVKFQSLEPYTAKYAFYEILKFHEFWYLRVMTSYVSVRRAPVLPGWF